MDNLQKQGCLVFRTDEQGSIIATSDGKSLIWNCTPSETWQAGKQQENQHNNEDNVASDKGIDQENNGVQDLSDIKYILNTNTKKFHYPTCASVNDMKEKNKKTSSESREIIINQGYVPCKRCNP